MKYYHLIKTLISSLSLLQAFKLFSICAIANLTQQIEIKTVDRKYDTHNLKWLTANWDTEDKDVYKELYELIKPIKTETLILFV